MKTLNERILKHWITTILGLLLVVFVSTKLYLLFDKIIMSIDSMWALGVISIIILLYSFGLFLFLTKDTAIKDLTKKIIDGFIKIKE